MVKFLARVLVAFVFLVGAAGASAQDRVRVGWAAMTASHTPLWVAQEKGFLT
jgi:ABC-type nitrate/sulfonate/bicarbonate transport system substrate-binding protein